MLNPQAPIIDIPFSCRHQCWFCAEPSNLLFHHKSTKGLHPELCVPACQECLKLAQKNPLTSIWSCRDAVKDALMQRYQKHLAIGINWTEQELAESGFECKALGGFRKSAWFMYTVARDRVNAPGWPIQINGVPIDSQHANSKFEFDGVQYTSIYRAVRHYAKHQHLDETFLSELVHTLGEHRFGYCIRLAQIHIGSNREMKQHVLKELKQQSLTE